MTTYNCVKYLEHAVRSLQSQTLTNWELIVVDDRSTDGTDSQLRALAEEDDRIVCLHNRHNVGCYAAKNTAIAYARGEWLTFHDADDHSMSERLEKQLWYCVTGESDRRGRIRARGAHPPAQTADQGYDACCPRRSPANKRCGRGFPSPCFCLCNSFAKSLARTTRSASAPTRSCANACTASACAWVS